MPRLVHLVLLKQRKGSDLSAMEAALASIESLREKIDGVEEVVTGPDASVEGLQQGYTHAAVVHFENEEARARYLPHPAHQEAVRQLEPLINGIVVVDLEC